MAKLPSIPPYHEVIILEDIITIDKSGYSLVLDKKTGCIRALYDNSEDTPVNLVDESRLFASVCVTFKDEISYHMETSKVIEQKHYIVVDDKSVSHEVVSAGSDFAIAENKSLNSRLYYEFAEDSFTIACEASNNRLSQFGLNMDFNFLGKPQSDYNGQVLPSSPYTSADGQSSYYLMTRPNGKFLLVTATNPIAGWKLEYSTYNFGHFILGLKMLGSFDKVFPCEAGVHKVVISLSFPSSYEDALNKVSNILNAPVPYFSVSGAAAGTELPVYIIGRCRGVTAITPSNKREELSLRYVNGRQLVMVPLRESGFYRVDALGENKKVLDCTLFSFPSWGELYYKSSVTINAPYHIDENLAEGGAWCWALCEYLKRYKPIDSFVRQVADFLERKVMAETNPVPRCSVVSFPHSFEGKEYDAYHIYKSTRIQEQFFGVSILLSAYQAFKEERYLEYAVKTMETLLNQHIDSSGRIVCVENGYCIDYTTVCAPVIAVADLAVVLLEKGDPRGALFRDTAVRIADFLVERGLKFPTEGDQEYAVGEMEDGSISCTALSVLYVCRYLQYKKSYIDFAGEILKLHDAWCIYTPDVKMYRSSFRWWETIWEGDRNGPGINAGHAWTIWRGEADFHYALLTCDFDKLMSSYNAYMTNLCKIAEDGTVTACYVPDYIPFGAEPGRIVHSFPENKDRSLSRYIWPRAVNSWFITSGLRMLDGVMIPINGSVRVCSGCNEFKSAAEDFKIFVLGEWSGTLKIITEKPIRLLHKDNNLSVLKGCLKRHKGFEFEIEPSGGQIEVESTGTTTI